MYTWYCKVVFIWHCLTFFNTHYHADFLFSNGYFFFAFTIETWLKQISVLKAIISTCP